MLNLDKKVMVTTLLDQNFEELGSTYRVTLTDLWYTLRHSTVTTKFVKLWAPEFQHL